VTTRFTWNEDKASRNLRSHRISFDVARNVFSDPYVRYVEDCEIDGETRYHAIGFANEHLLPVVVFIDGSDANEDIVHIISARKA
jgi:uncharacterized DUF497 family protein